MTFNWYDGLMGWSPCILWGFEALRAGGLKCAIDLRNYGIEKSACEHWFSNYPRSLTDSWWFLSPNPRDWVKQQGRMKKVRGFDLQWVWVFTSKKVQTDVTNGLMSCALCIVTTWERMILVPQVNRIGPLKVLDSHKMVGEHVSTAIRHIKKNKSFFISYFVWHFSVLSI